MGLDSPYFSTGWCIITVHVCFSTILFEYREVNEKQDSGWSHLDHLKRITGFALDVDGEN
jgi:hypothetical protein